MTNSPDARNADGSLKDASKVGGTDPASTPAPTEPDKSKPPSGAPATYTDFTVPKDYTLDKALLDEAVPIFKEMNLTQDAAQKLVDWYSKTQIANSKKADETVTTMRAAWRDEITKDPVLGPKLDSVRADIGKAFTNVLGPDLTTSLKAALDLTGAGDNPAVIRAFVKFAEAVNEGTHVAGRGPSPLGQTLNGQVRPPTAAQALYPTLPSSQR